MTRIIFDLTEGVVMKNLFKPENLFIYFISISFLGLLYYNDFLKIVSFLTFTAAVLVLFLFKNKFLAYGLSLILMLVCAINHNQYMIFIMPVYLLIIIYRNIIKKISADSSKKARHGNIGHIGLHFMILLALGGGLFAWNKFLKNDYFAYYKEADELPVIAVAMVVIFVVGAFSKNVSREVRRILKISNENYITLNLVNLTALLMFSSSVFLNYAAYQDLQINYTVVCFPWMVWLCVLVYEKNPITEAILKLIEEEIKKISERRIKEK